MTGVLPPLSADQWNEEFAKYRQIPQYQAVHAGMTVEEFKGIFLWEYLHRLWARLVTIAFAIPLIWFAVKGMVPRAMRPRLWLLLLLLGLQGALGWFMVSSGLSVRTEVSQYRLAAHFAAALLIYGATVWTAADFLARPGDDHNARWRTMRRALVLLSGLTILTAIAGAFVAGLRAGRMYNTFPLMGGQVVPDGYASHASWWRNLFENPIAAQFNHRFLALVTVFSVLACWIWSRGRSLPSGAARAMALFAGVALLQVALGITTLLLRVPVSLGVAHQGGAVLLVTCAILAVHSLSRRSLGA